MGGCKGKPLPTKRRWFAGDRVKFQYVPKEIYTVLGWKKDDWIVIYYCDRDGNILKVFTVDPKGLVDA